MRTAWVKAQLGKLYIKLGDLKKAKNLIEQSLEINRKTHGNDTLWTAWVLVRLGYVYEELGNNTQALNCFEASRKIYTKYFKQGHMKLMAIYWHLGNIYKNLENYEKAKDLLQKTLAAYECQYGKDHVEVARVLADIGRVYLLEGDTLTAEDYIKRSLTIFMKIKHPDRYTPLEMFAELYLKKTIQAVNQGKMQEAQKDKKQAFNYLIQAQELVEKHFPENSPHFIRIQEKLKRLNNI